MRMSLAPVPGIALSSGLFALMTAGSALAVDPAAFAAKLEATFAGSEISFTLGTGRETADGLVFPAARFALPREMDIDPVIVELNFTGINELSDGGYTVDLVTTPDIRREEDGRVLTMEDIRLERVNVPGVPSSTTFTEGMFTDSRGGTGRIRMLFDGEEQWSIESVAFSSAAETGADGQMSRGEQTFALEDIFLNIAVNTNPDLESFAEVFGQTEFRARLTGTSTFDAAEARAGLDSLLLEVEGLGRLDLDMQMGGLTPEFIATAQKAFVDMQALEQAGATEAELAKAQTAFGMVVLSQLSFLGTGMSFEDMGLTSRLIGMVAETEGSSRTRVARDMREATVDMLREAGMDELAAKADAELRKYFANPHDIAFSARPSMAMPLVMLTAAAVQPQVVLNMLKLDIVANRGMAEVEDAPPSRPAERSERTQRPSEGAPRGGIQRVPRN